MKKIVILTFLLLLPLIIGNNAMAQTRSVIVDGFCYLAGMSDHSGTNVLFYAVSPSAVTDSTFTNEDGSFAIILSEGIYTVHYSHEGWESYTIPGQIAFFEDTTLPDITLYSVDVTIDGFCYLVGVSNHSGTKVLFNAVSLPAFTDSTFTNEDGSFAIEISSGTYTVQYSHKYWESYTIPGEIELVEDTTLTEITLNHDYITVDGFCYLSGMSNHLGTKVLFSGVNSSAITDSTFTNEDGSFAIILSEGIYTVHYSHEGWEPYTIPEEIEFVEDTTLANVTLSLEVIGPQSGIWSTGETYNVIGDISVNTSDTLIIEHGVTIKFMGFYSFTIYGTLFAEGTEMDSILFTSGEPEPYHNDWDHIKFEGNSSSNSIISYSKVEYATYGIYCDASSPSISNNTIINNGRNGDNGSPPGDGYGSGIYCTNLACPNIHDNTISNNGGKGGESEDQPIDSGSGNGYGVYCDNSSPNISNNTIVNNGGKGGDKSYFYSSPGDGYGSGIYCVNSSCPNINNNIISDNGGEGGNYYYKGYSFNIISNNNGNGSASNTISSGSGNGYGVYCNNSSPDINNNAIVNNGGNGGSNDGLSSSGNGYGSGIYCVNSSCPNISDNIINDNGGDGANNSFLASGGNGYGSGIYCIDSSPIINNNTIRNNGGKGGETEDTAIDSRSGNGYGVYCDNSSPTISNNSISNNDGTGGNYNTNIPYVSAGPGYSYGIYCINISSPIIRNNSIDNNVGIGGGNSSSFNKNEIFNYNNLPGGNSGGSGYGYGIYSDNSYPNISGNTIINNGGNGGEGYNCRDSDFHYEGLEGDKYYTTIRASGGKGKGYGIYCNASNPQIDNNLLCNNCGVGGYGIECANGGDGYGIGIYFNDYLSGNINNNTILNNAGIGGNSELGYDGYGYGYGIGTNSSSPNILNNIVFNNNGDDYGYGIYADSILTTLEYNLFFQNDVNGFGVPPYFGVIVTVNANGDSCDTYCNLFMDPLFVDTLTSNYHLTDNSPCIDAGNPDTTGLNLPEFDLDGNPRIYNSIVDMGCYEWQGIGVDDWHNSTMTDVLYQNYPNPFSTSTTISYNSASNKHEITQIKIYNTRGQLVKTLLPITNNKLQITNVIWDGKDENGNPLSNGIYFYQLKTASYNGIKKMIIIR